MGAAGGNRPSTDKRFRALFEAHHQELHAYCLRRLPVEDANEATSEIFLVAWRRADDVPAFDELFIGGIKLKLDTGEARAGHMEMVARFLAAANND